MASREARVERSKVVLKERGKAQALKVGWQNCLIKIRESTVGGGGVLAEAYKSNF
jgi:hypothetical protein